MVAMKQSFQIITIGNYMILVDDFSRDSFLTTRFWTKPLWLGRWLNRQTLPTESRWRMYRTGVKNLKSRTLVFRLLSLKLTTRKSKWTLRWHSLSSLFLPLLVLIPSILPSFPLQDSFCQSLWLQSPETVNCEQGIVLVLRKKLSSL